MKKSKPLVSICCSAYNHEMYIRDAVEGFLAQKTDFPVEVLIHDDASTDKTADIVKEYAEKHPDLIFPIFQKENQYSKGIKIPQTFQYPRAKGKYIALCEGDDYWTDPGKLQTQVDFLERNEEYAVCYHNVNIIDKDNNVVLRNSGPQTDFAAIELMKGPIIPLCSMCFRNEIIGLPGEGYRMPGGHRMLISRLGRLGKGKWFGDRIKPAIYRNHPGGMWSGLSDIETFFMCINTSYWLYRYYKRLGSKEIEQHFFNEFTKKINTGYYLRHPRKALLGFIIKKGKLK